MFGFPIKNRMESGLPSILQLYRIGIFMVTAILVFREETAGAGHAMNSMLLLVLCIHEVLMAVCYKQFLKQQNTQLLLCCADCIIAAAAITLTGGIHSPFILYSTIAVFTLHLLYRIKGAFLGTALYGLVFAVIGAVSNELRAFDLNPDNQGITLAGITLCLMVFYGLPYLAFRHYDANQRHMKILSRQYRTLDGFNNRLMTLAELTGKLRYGQDPDQIMEKLAAMCSEIFQVERICIFLIRKGETAVYGRPTSQEKENIYRLIVDHQRNEKLKLCQEPFYDQGTAMIPLIRGGRLDGVLSLPRQEVEDMSREDALLLTMTANIISTYLENLVYMEGLVPTAATHESGVAVTQLQSGKPVKGRLDHRIFAASDSGSDLCP